MSYALIKMIHVSSVITSFLLFFVRGLWLIKDSPKLRQRWVKILPHIVDTILLTSAVTLAFKIQQSPFVDAWLTAKVIGILIYIGLGMVAMRFGKTRRTRITAWVAAECVFIYIVLVALTKSPVLGLF
ncbi:SirB2 family protein [Nitrosomonas sp.]|uniref:SirB2 family protein n=1 Tax=Nitrosomonas sp. TaxID=42353 RepID=UPI00284B660B|nr:SirB2 family protein [Nitrosomonas sp.]MCP5243906.1 SirB2 family protein [Burkholderiales bacterium]MDR4514524.1 SirB2 family protein [Nitrosomonas sp.]